MHDGQSELVAVAHLAARGDDVGVAHRRSRPPPDRDGAASAPPGSTVSAYSRMLRAVQLDAIHAGDGAQLRRRLVDHEVRQLRQASAAREVTATPTIGNAEVSRMRASKSVSGGSTGRVCSIAACTQLQSALHVLVPAEHEIELRAAARRHRANGLHAEDAGQRVFQRLRDRGQRLLDGEIAGARDDGDAMEGDLGKDRDRHRGGRPDAGDDEQRRDAEDGGAIAADETPEGHSLGPCTGFDARAVRQRILPVDEHLVAVAEAVDHFHPSTLSGCPAPPFAAAPARPLRP